MPESFWRGLDRAIGQDERERKLPLERRTDPLAPFREAAYAAVRAAQAENLARRGTPERISVQQALCEQMPWEQHGWGRPLNSHNVQFLLESMALTFTTNDELTALLVCMDAARDVAHIPGATGYGGRALIERASGRLPEPPLPEHWSSRAIAMCGRSQQLSSASYWATAMLEAAGHRVRPDEHEHRAEGPEGPGIA